MSPENIPFLPIRVNSSWWGLKDLYALRSHYFDYYKKIQAKHPDIAHLKILSRDVFHVFHPELVREILVHQSHLLIRWERATKEFSYSMGDSVLVTEGKQWERQRRILQPCFSPKKITDYAKLITLTTHSSLIKLTNAKDKQLTDIEVLMTNITLDVIMRVIFGNHQIKNSKPIAQAIQTLSQFAFNQILGIFPWPIWAPIKSVYRARLAIRKLNQLITQHMSLDTHDDQLTQNSLLKMLRDVRDPNNLDNGLSEQELHDQIMVMFQAGHETSSTALTWWAGLMASHTDLLDRIEHEVNSVLQGQDPTPETLNQLPLLQASLKETLRLYPPAAILFTRRSLQKLHVGQYQIPRGSLISFSPFLIQRDERWFDAPDEFRPERFLDGQKEIPRGAWIPFGTGPRVCIGQHFALMEMGIIAVMLIQRFRLKWPENQTWPSTNLAVTLKPATPMNLELVPTTRKF